jgi:hypothetical protein
LSCVGVHLRAMPSLLRRSNLLRARPSSYSYRRMFSQLAGALVQRMRWIHGRCTSLARSWARAGAVELRVRAHITLRSEMGRRASVAGRGVSRLGRRRRRPPGKP